jgi:ferrous iron transport protein B
MKRIVALAGRPNTGKTTLFNALTGMRQRVANFAGCTVEKAIGEITVGDTDIEIVDLPGTHSLLPETEDEKVAFSFLSECAENNVDLQVICTAEASNLSNDLALAAGLKSAGYPILIAVNMMDEARLNGVIIDPDKLSELMGLPVALTSARNGEGLEALQQLLLCRNPLRTDLSECIDFRHVSSSKLQVLQSQAVALATEAYRQSVTFPTRGVLPMIARSIRIDRVIFHPLVGPLLLISTMFLLFQALFSWAKPAMDLLSHMLATLSNLTRQHIPEGILSSLLCDGVIPGISAVVVFVPQITEPVSLSPNEY